MRKHVIVFLLAACWLLSSTAQVHIIHPVPLKQVRIDDPFWSPRLNTWHTKTVYDVFDKLEGKYEPDRKDLIEEKQRKGRTNNAFLNFDRVAKGEKDTKNFDGLPWFDGLIYESIRGAADLLIEYPDPALEKRIDAYIVRFAAAQSADKTGYLNTYTTLHRSHQRWGSNGGDDKWQHDIYNSGMLFEAAVHYYKATGKTNLLELAVKQANCICNEIGPAPKVNAIPGHGGPEEALLKMYQLFKAEPALKKKIKTPVEEERYFNMVKCWIENRGHYGGDNGYATRKSDSSYNQDHQPVFQQQTIEGHAVRATLLATGVTAVALHNQDANYITTANNYWNNMVGKRMFITGGEGALAEGERFGADYYLPESAYLETCAAIGAGFFSERMNELQADGRYIDELERVLYNNLLSGVSQSGDHYFYENPLRGTAHKRWAWHSCPCCPPMFLKMVGILPSCIYAYDANDVYVNLFIGSEANIVLESSTVQLKQQTNYPWSGQSIIEVNPARPAEFTVHVRIPGWAQGKENPFDLYRSNLTGTWSIKVNGQEVNTDPVKGYAAIRRNWKKGDKIQLELPIQPRVVFPNDNVNTLKGKAAIAAGPIVYAMEGNEGSPTPTMQTNFQSTIAGGVNVITTGEGKKAIPFYAIGNSGTVLPYTVWLPIKQ